MMEICFGSSLQLQENHSVLDCEALPDKAPAPDSVLDSGYFSAGSSLSPTSSVDSFCFSPSSLPALANEQDVFSCFLFNRRSPTQLGLQTQTHCRSSSAAPSTTKKSRARYPSKKRQNASEREKLRMRDLTKALNHLRTYLPPSVAPAGQTLTKIETLRLTIRYISYLSAQLGLSEDVLELRRATGFNEHNQTLIQFMDQPAESYRLEESNCNNDSQGLVSLLQPSHKDLARAIFTPDLHWSPQQQSKHGTFPGHR